MFSWLYHHAVEKNYSMAGGHMNNSSYMHRSMSTPNFSTHGMSNGPSGNKGHRNLSHKSNTLATSTVPENYISNLAGLSISTSKVYTYIQQASEFWKKLSRNCPSRDDVLLPRQPAKQAFHIDKCRYLLSVLILTMPVFCTRPICTQSKFEHSANTAFIDAKHLLHRLLPHPPVSARGRGSARRVAKASRQDLFCMDWEKTSMLTVLVLEYWPKSIDWTSLQSRDTLGGLTTVQLRDQPAAIFTFTVTLSAHSGSSCIWPWQSWTSLPDKEAFLITGTWGPCLSHALTQVILGFTTKAKASAPWTSIWVLTKHSCKYCPSLIGRSVRGSSTS